MFQALALVLGVALGFVGSRALRRPSHTASAASVARNVGGALGARRGRSLPELQRATFSEMMRHVRVNRGGDTAVPVRYLVRLHPSDAAVVEESPRFFTDGLAEALRTAASTHGWTIDGPISINVEADESRHPGAPAVLAVPPGRPASQDPTPPPAGPAVAESVPQTAPTRRVSGPLPQMLHRLDTGERIELTTKSLTIGRGADRDVVIEDNRVSRHHAVVAPHGSGWIVTDTRSSNGTRLNGSALTADEPATLRTGDTIQVGPVSLRFGVDDRPERRRDPASGSAGPDDATGVLDDATRQRISGEFHWPSDDMPRGGAARDRPE